MPISDFTITSIKEARGILEDSIKIFHHCKSAISKTLSSIEDCKSVISESIVGTLRFQRQTFENALKELNRSHTIWRCRSEDNNLDISSDRCSSTWLENEWEEHCTLDDQADEILYAHSLKISGCLISAYNISNEVTVTSEVPVLVSDASNSSTVASEVPVLVSDESNSSTVASKVPVLVSDE